jgi:hypothetical protein
MTDDVSKSINIPKGLRIVAEEINLHVWKPGTAIESNSNNEIIIPYGLRTSISDNGIIFHKLEDGITNNTLLNQLENTFGMKFDYDDTYFIIRKPSDPTQCIKVAWGSS